MKPKRSYIVVSLLALISLTIACSLTDGTPQKPEVPPDDSNTIATAVAGTMAASEVGNTQPTVHPTVTASGVEPNFNCAGVQFYFNDLLAESITVNVNPGEYDANSPWWSKPEHRECIFNNWVLVDAFHTAAIRVYPVADYQAINENVSGGLDGLTIAFESQPADHAGLRVPDLYNAGQLFQAQVKYMDFQNGAGARWLSQYGQAYSTIGWPHLFYTFQGITEDGQYYVSLILPVNHPSLPHPNNVTMDDAFAENYDSYAEATALQLNGESDNSFVPSLVLLDQLVESLLVGVIP